ncbi:MAG: hypothetical protein EOO90_00275 [Pedobacter sp.]|nr:MAG: hypothetical protein EOO90_00275 [Pedobacter sp.]
MKADIIFDHLGSTLSKKAVEELAKMVVINQFSIKDLVNLTFHKDEKIGFRASWILETLYINDTEYFAKEACYFLNRFGDQNNLSSRRHFGKILALMTAKNAPKGIKDLIINTDTEAHVETVFNWLIDEHVPVAIKSHCLNILANLCLKHSWIKDELRDTMDFLVDKESIAFFAKVKQIRKQLAKT